MTHLTLKLISLVALVLLTANQDDALLARREPVKKPRHLRVPFLPNAIRLHPKVISGGSPNGKDGFRQLAKLGVQTVISVDGLKPDIASAKSFGLRYVHLPHGYDGIKPSRVRELAKAVHELPGPIYIHCHHGKHRSPAAAVSACITLGYLSPTLGEPMLKLAGTSPEYAGLYRCVRDTKCVPLKAIDAVQVQFRETVELPPIVEVMTRLETITDGLEQHRNRGWRSAGLNSDSRSAHDALLLQELFTELQRDPAVKKREEKFRALLGQSETAAKQLRLSLKSLKPDEKTATESLRSIRAKCVACHHEFRD